jgi:hypothetical protein
VGTAALPPTAFAASGQHPGAGDHCADRVGDRARHWLTRCASPSAETSPPRDWNSWQHHRLITSEATHVRGCPDSTAVLQSRWPEAAPRNPEAIPTRTAGPVTARGAEAGAAAIAPTLWSAQPPTAIVAACAIWRRNWRYALSTPNGGRGRSVASGCCALTVVVGRRARTTCQPITSHPSCANSRTRNAASRIRRVGKEWGEQPPIVVRRVVTPYSLSIGLRSRPRAEWSALSGPTQKGDVCCDQTATTWQQITLGG